MLTLKFIRENKDLVEKSLNHKNSNINISEIIDLDENRRKLLKEVESYKAERNKVTSTISELKKNNKDSKNFIDNMRLLSEKIKNIEIELKVVNEKIESELFYIPNIIHDSVPIGTDEKDNIVIREWGEKPKFSFTPLNHLEIGEKFNLFNFKNSVKMAGSGFPLYIGIGARLERSLINYMLDFHILNNKYTELMPPFLANYDAMKNTGQLPKFEDDMYNISQDNLFCIPTAEVPVTNIHQKDILNESDLPIKYVAYSSCFRREAGSYGKDTKGLNRLHQFNKVELVKFVHPNNSYSELELLLEDAEKILKSFNLHYRVIELCSGDLSFSASKCYDIEVWSCAENRYLEVSSCSNFEDFQSRRGNIRFRSNDSGKIEFVHTLNGSGIATPRLMIAMLEANQNKNGTINIPEVLHPYMDLKEII